MNLDDDVTKEKEKILQADPRDYDILVKGVRKVYNEEDPAHKKVAVNDLSFSVNKGDVFGLLGVNGAGKTTTFKTICGEEPAASGSCYICGIEIGEDIEEARKNLGYCPQFDALLDNLTVRKQL